MSSNSKDALDLYAKVEDLLGVKEVAPKLYSYYFDILDKKEFNSLLDIGCGSGDFLIELKKRYPNKLLDGIDKSPLMVDTAKKKALNAYNLDIKDLNKSYDIATAVFDMINYLTPQEFIDFFKDLHKIINDGGFFIFDVNSEFGLSELAVGNFIAEDSNRFLAIESFYEAGVYESFFTLFEKETKNCYKKEKQIIKQYHYSEDFFRLLGGWELDSMLPIKLYDMENYDKIIYVLKKI